MSSNEEAPFSRARMRRGGSRVVSHESSRARRCLETELIAETAGTGHHGTSAQVTYLDPNIAGLTSLSG